MVDIFINRRVGKYKAGEIVHNVELDAYWNAHVAAANVTLLLPYIESPYADDDEDFLVTIAADRGIDLDAEPSDAADEEE